MKAYMFMHGTLVNNEFVTADLMTPSFNVAQYN